VGREKGKTHTPHSFLNDALPELSGKREPRTEEMVAKEQRLPTLTFVQTPIAVLPRLSNP
jgi:hypothetical protein